MSTATGFKMIECSHPDCKNRIMVGIDCDEACCDEHNGSVTSDPCRQANINLDISTELSAWSGTDSPNTQSER